MKLHKERPSDRAFCTVNGDVQCCFLLFSPMAFDASHMMVLIISGMTLLLSWSVQLSAFPSTAVCLQELTAHTDRLFLPLN